MKKLICLFLSIFIITLASCSSDDNGNNNQEATLLGNWNSSEFIMEGTFEEDGITVSFEGVADNMPGNDITFHSDNTFTGNSAPFEMEINYLINGLPSTITQTMNSPMAHEGTWRKDGDKLFIIEAGSTQEQEFNIETLSNTTLKMFADQDNIEMEDDFPENAEFKVTITHIR